VTKTVLKTALEAEMSEHLGYERHDPVGRDGANSRNGTRTPGPVLAAVPGGAQLPGSAVSVHEPC
jgi:putative transposase